MRPTFLVVPAMLMGLSAGPAHAQYWGGTTTVVTGGSGFVSVGRAPVIASPVYPTTVVASPYSVVTPAPVVVRRPAVVASPYVVSPAPVLMTPGVTVVRPGWGYGGPFGPRPWGRGWRGW